MVAILEMSCIFFFVLSLTPSLTLFTLNNQIMLKSFLQLLCVT